MCTGGCILSVAVVKNSSLDISSLRGLRSCHSAVRWTAGWSLPLGFLLSRNYLSWSKEHPLSRGRNNSTPLSVFIGFPLQVQGLQVFRSTLCLSSRADVSSFFSASCVPGAAALAPSLCALCQGEKSFSLQKNYHCETSHSEPFYNSQGALRSGATNNAHLFFFVFSHECKLSTMQTLMHLLFHRCLRSGAADVAFVDHLALESIEGKPLRSSGIF